MPLDLNQLRSRLARHDWERLEIHSIDEWWADGAWRLRSTRRPATAEFWLTFMVDPQWDGANTGETPPIYALLATQQIPYSRRPTDQIADAGLASRKLSPRIDAFIEEVNAFRDEQLALTDLREPWSTEALGENLAAELAKELPPAHPLHGDPTRAIARRQDRDDVLFVIRGDIRRYAVVHLTWSGKAERDGWPAFETYQSAADWRRRRMTPDHLDWSE